MTMRLVYRSIRQLHYFSRRAWLGILDEVRSIPGVYNKTFSATQVPLDAVSVREATVDDEEAVLNIDRNIYFGQDFLPFYYKTYMSCVNTTSLVAEINNTVVGFSAQTLADDGDAVISRAIRVKPSYRSRGIVRALGLEILRRNKNKRIISTYSSLDVIGSGFISRSYKHILKRQVHGFEIKVEFEKFYLGTRYKTMVSTVLEDDLKSILMSKPLTQYLFPKDRIVVSWLPLKLTQSNVPFVFWHDDVMFSDVRYSRRMNTNFVRKGLLTSSSYFPVSKSQWVCNIDVFGTDMLSLESHFLAHVNNLQNRVCSGDRVCVYFCSEDGIPLQKCITEILEKHGVTLLHPTEQTSRMRELRVLEWKVTADEFIENIPQKNIT